MAPGSRRAGRGQTFWFETAAQPEDACTTTVSEVGRLIVPVALRLIMSCCAIR